MIAADKILVISLRRLGDAFLATPVLKSLQAAYPAALIDFLCYESSGSMIKDTPKVNALQLVPDAANAAQLVGILAKLWRHYDLAVATMPNDKSVLCALAAGKHSAALIPQKRWQDAWKRRLCDTWAEERQYVHILERNLDIVRALGIPPVYEFGLPKNTEPVELNNAHLNESSGFAVVHPYPMFRYKAWPVTSWRALIEALHKRFGLHIVLTGGPDATEQQYLANLHAGSAAFCSNYCAQLSFADISELCGRARLFVGPDTCVTHLAAASGAPTVALFGPTDPLLWGPWPQNWQQASPFARVGSQQCGNVTLLQGTGECVPCHKEGCERHLNSHSDCLDNLQVATVLAACENALNRIRA